MFEKLVCNASPLIFLSRVGGLGWLCHLSRAAMAVPAAVESELSAGPAGTELVQRLREEHRIQFVPDLPVPAVIGAWDLGRGESQVLTTAWDQPGYTAILDDLQARRGAAALGTSVLGTLGVVLAARRQGWILAARPIVEQLVHSGMYLAPSLVAAALSEVGES